MTKEKTTKVDKDKERKGTEIEKVETKRRKADKEEQNEEKLTT